MRHPLSNASGEVLLGVGGDCVENSNADNGNTGELENAERIVPGNFMNKTVQPAIGGLTFENIIEDDLQWPGFGEVGCRLADNSQEAKNKSAGMRFQERANVQPLRR